ADRTTSCSRIRRTRWQPKRWPTCSRECRWPAVASWWWSVRVGIGGSGPTGSVRCETNATARPTFGTVTDMTKVVCPGSFDPVTNGHVDIFDRAASLFDEVIVVVLVNESKKGLFPIEKRLELLADATERLPNVSLDSYNGLLVDYCTQNGVDA